VVSGHRGPWCPPTAEDYPAADTIPRPPRAFRLTTPHRLHSLFTHRTCWYVLYMTHYCTSRFDSLSTSSANTHAPSVFLCAGLAGHAVNVVCDYTESVPTALSSSMRTSTVLSRKIMCGPSLSRSVSLRSQSKACYVYMTPDSRRTESPKRGMHAAR
jgi:hypothetical protein